MPSNKKKYCSRSCAVIVNNSRYKKRSRSKSCKICNNLILSDRTYCDSHKDSRSRKISQWKSGTWSGGSERKLSETIRKYMLEKHNYSCEICGFNEKHPDDGASILEIDHINGIGSDHREENLKVLCPNHHALTSTYRARNRGNGRKVFYIRVLK